MFIAEGIATDGLQPPRKAVKVTVFREERPGINYLRALEAQTTGQFRVQYQEWPEGRSQSRWQEQGESAWHTAAEAFDADQEAARA